MVKIFVTPVCPYCYTLKEFLKECNIEFEEIDVSQDEKLKEELIKKTGKMEVPILEIGDQFVVGFDKEKICKLLKIPK
jgi:glutaredoxin 3